MADNVNINVEETNEIINIVASEVQEVIDINVFETAENVTLNITEDIIEVNINKVTAAEQIQSDWNQTDVDALDFIKNKPTIPSAVTNTSDLINDGADGVNPFITLEDIPPVTGFVPYTGATQDVDLGEYELKAGQVEFDQTPTGAAGVGVMRWNDTDGTLDLGLKGGNVTLQLGQEQVARVVNKTATNITLLESNYQAVRVTGAQGQRLKVDLALATNDLLSAETIGLVTETIASNQEGFITVSGLVRNINTTGSLQGETWEDGDVLYLSPSIAGRITNIKPTAPNHLVVIGYVVYAHANNGKIFVKVNNGYELEELHNVTETNYTTPIDTDSLLTFDITNSLWKRLSWLNIKSNLKTYFDTIYQATLGFTPENVANKSTDVNLGTSDTLYPTQNAVKVYADTKLDRVTTASSVYGTDESGEQVMKPTSEFKDVLEFANLASFPANGESSKIYLALDTNLQYRWSGSAYVQIGGGGTTKIIGLVNDAVTVLSVAQGGGVNTIMHSFLIPANKISNSLIEVDYFAVRTLGTTNPTLSFNLYISNNNNLTGGVAIGIIGLNGSQTGQQIRYSLFTENNILYRSPENAGGGGSNYSPSSIDFTQPVYFHFYIFNGGIITADSTRYFRHINVKAIKSI